jgi:hypothetical protein
MKRPRSATFSRDILSIYYTQIIVNNTTYIEHLVKTILVMNKYFFPHREVS